MMVAKSKPKPKLTEDEIDEMLDSTAKPTNHADHVRSKNYDKNCYYCIAFGFIQDEKM